MRSRLMVGSTTVARAALRERSTKSAHRRLVRIVVLGVILAFFAGAVPAQAAPVVTDSYPESNWAGWGWFLCGNMSTQIGQSFTPADAGSLDSAKFYMRRHGSPTGLVSAALYAHSGTYGTDGIPTGPPLATSAPVDATTIGDVFELVTFTFDNTVPLTAGTHYFIAVMFEGGTYSVGGVNHYLDVGYDYDEASHSGSTAGYWAGDPALGFPLVLGWNPYVPGPDTIFYVYVNPAAPPTGTLRGTVWDAMTGLPIAGATVDAGAAGTTSTGADGIYTFTNVPEGSYTAAASKTGYGPESAGGVVVVGGQSTTQDFALNPTPATAIDDIINAVDEAVGDGSLAGTGPGNSAQGKLGA